jgi:sugar phosphate isomerase/epimerase
VTLGPDDLVLTSSSIGCPSFPVMVTAAARAGFAGLSLWPPETYAVARRDGFTPEQLRALLDDAGVVAHEVDALVTWAGANDPGEPYLQAAPRAFVLETADALGAQQANAIVVGERGTAAREIADAVDALCEEAERAGVRVGVEFARGSLVRTLADARAVLDALPHRDLGITVDAWQLHWGPSTAVELGAVRGTDVYSVQLDDAPADRPDDFGRATYEGRLVPGTGAADLVGLLRTLDTIGYAGPLTVETINADLIASHDPIELACLLADATRAVRTAARTEPTAT